MTSEIINYICNECGKYSLYKYGDKYALYRHDGEPNSSLGIVPIALSLIAIILLMKKILNDKLKSTYGPLISALRSFPSESSL